MLQRFSKSSSIYPILQYATPSTPTSLQCSSIPPNTPAPHNKCSSVSVNALGSAQTFQHPGSKISSIPPNTPKSPQILQHLPKHSSTLQKAPASSQHRALMPPPLAPHTAPHWAQLPAAFGAATTQLGQEGLTPRSPGSWDAATGGRCNVPCPLPPAAVQVPAGGRCPASGRDPAAGRRVRTSGRREERQVQGKMPSCWKRPSPLRLGWNKPQHPFCATAAPERGN